VLALGWCVAAGGGAAPAWAIGATCNPAGSPLERAQCTIDAAGQTGAGDPGGWTPGHVPGFVTDTPPETGYFDTSGNPAALDHAAAQAATSPQADDLRDKRDQAAGYDLTHSAPAETARQVAQQPGIDPRLSRQCQTTTTCVSWSQTPSGGGVCQTPGTQQETCVIVETPQATALTHTASGNYFTYITAGNRIAWCVTLTWTGSGVVAVSVAGTDCPAYYQVTTFNAAPPPVSGRPFQLAEGMTISFYSNCWGSSQWTLSSGYPVVQFGSACGGGYVGFSFNWTYNRTGYAITTAVTDGCAWLVALAQQNRATLQGTSCLEAGDTPVTANNGVQILVPITYSTRGCWREQQTWLRTSDVPDTCGPYREQGCAQTSSTCGQQDGFGNCVYYEQTYQCLSATCSAEQTVQICATCGDPNGLVPFCLDDATPPDQSLARTAAWLQVLQNAKDQWDPNTLTIFRGDRVQCTHGAGFGNMGIDNCCADPPQGGSCTQTDWDAYAARREKRAHYLGEYCSNWVNLLVGRICVERTIAWCAFPTSFARIVHDQGRPAIGRGWGTPESPDCGPFTLAEFQQLPFNQMDFSEVYDQLLITNDQQGLASSAQQAASQATGR
jgi:conjugal transfer mating pair stabilization protein TraN